MKAEVKQILEKVDNLLHQAEIMHEAKEPSGTVNRAYYALFTSIQALLFEAEIFTKSHSGAHNKFRELFIKTGKLPVQLNEHLRIAFELRQAVDYDFDDDTDMETAGQVLKNAKEFCQTIRQHLLH